jgi:CRP/FNR family transcriptional regulator, cyclic AMP receptor protein
LHQPAGPSVRDPRRLSQVLAASLPNETRPLVVTLPVGDRVFANAAASKIGAIGTRKIAIRIARRELRESFPLADLHCQRNVAIGGRSTEVWFAYRDGRRAAPAAPSRWWNDRATAKVVVRPSGRLVRPNDRFRSLMRTPVMRNIAWSRDVLPPMLDGLMTERGGLLREFGELTSIATLRDNAGHSMDVDYHAVWDGAGPDRHQLIVRPVADRDAAMVRGAVFASSLGRSTGRVRDEMVRTGRIRELGPGDRLSESMGDEPWAVVVIAGLVRLHLVAETVEPTLAYGSVGSLIGTHWALRDPAIPVSLQAVTSSSVLLLSASRLRQLAAADDDLARAISDDGRMLLDEVVRLYALRSEAGLTQRVAREILLLADLQSSAPLVAVTEQQLADAVGSIRESVARSLADLRKRAVLATTRHGLLVLDSTRLRSLVAHLDA